MMSPPRADGAGTGRLPAAGAGESAAPAGSAPAPAAPPEPAPGAAQGPRRVALVSGGNRGIGLEICRQLAERGIAVGVGARDPAAAEAAAAKIGHGALGVQLDVTDPGSVARAVARLDEVFGRLDILVNNAGVYLDRGRPASEADFAAVAATLEVNVVGAWRLSAAVIPLMRRGGYGRIVNLSSGMGTWTSMQRSGGASAAYRLSKAALNALTVMLAAELRESGILVNAVMPGWVRTDMGGRSAPRTVAEGADTAVWLVTLAEGSPDPSHAGAGNPTAPATVRPSEMLTGRLFYNRNEETW